MKRFLKLLFFFLVITSGSVKSQDLFYATGEKLETLFTHLTHYTDDSLKISANDSIKTIIDEYVKTDGVFYHKFENLRFLGQITSPDSILKIITWNMLLENGKGRYFCYFVKKNPLNKNFICSLDAPYKETKIRTDSTINKADWYGALYYDARTCKVNGEECWMLLGIDYGNPLITRKLIDVLSLNPDGSPVFGKKWFEKEGKMSFREVFEYSSDAMMTLRFTSDSSIVFDHLVPFSSDEQDNHQYYGPDYSYDAFILKDGIWKLFINVDVRNKE